jgi:hypothetical protein
MLDLSLRLALCAGLSAALGGAVLAFGHHERDVGRAEVHALWNAEKSGQSLAIIKAQARAQAVENQQATKAQEVDTHVQAQIEAVAADRDRAVRVAASLRDTLNAVRADSVSSTTTHPRLAAEASALADSLGECGQRYSAMAGERDGLAVQVAGLLDLAPEDAAAEPAQQSAPAKQ